MKTLAQQHEFGFASGHTDIEKIVIQKDQDYENERTYWIFKSVVNNYELHCDNEKFN